MRPTLFHRFQVSFRATPSMYRWKICRGRVEKHQKHQKHVPNSNRFNLFIKQFTYRDETTEFRRAGPTGRTDGVDAARIPVGYTTTTLINIYTCPYQQYVVGTWLLKCSFKLIIWIHRCGGKTRESWLYLFCYSTKKNKPGGNDEKCYRFTVYGEKRQVEGELAILCKSMTKKILFWTPPNIAILF